ncbi:MAG: hypothetical protein ACREO4_11885 [Lysobacter sp.]
MPRHRSSSRPRPGSAGGGSERHAQHAETRLRERRHRVAHEAARLMAEGGLRDYRQAKLKAAQRLGITDDASLPRNREIEDALREHQRLFQPDADNELHRRREAALRALEFFQPFDPRLVGPVLEGTADSHSAVMLQVYSDDADAIARFLEQHGIPAEPGGRRLRLDRERSGDFPVWLFGAEGLAFDLTVLPRVQLRQAPLSTVDEKPMQRASATQLRQLLADEEIDGYEDAPSGSLLS